MGNVAKLPIVEKKLITIEKGVPIPRRGNGRRPKYPWRDMEVGDSFVISDATASRNAVRVRGTEAGRRLNRKFATRAVIENGVKVIRVWRVE